MCRFGERLRGNTISWHLFVAERIRFEFLISDHFLEHPRSVGDPRVGSMGQSADLLGRVVSVGQPPANHQKMGQSSEAMFRAFSPRDPNRICFAQA